MGGESKYSEYMIKLGELYWWVILNIINPGKENVAKTKERIKILAIKLFTLYCDIKTIIRKRNRKLKELISRTLCRMYGRYWNKRISYNVSIKKNNKIEGEGGIIEIKYPEVKSNNIMNFNICTEIETEEGYTVNTLFASYTIQYFGIVRKEYTRAITPIDISMTPVFIWFMSSGKQKNLQNLKLFMESYYGKDSSEMDRYNSSDYYCIVGISFVASGIHNVMIDQNSRLNLTTGERFKFGNIYFNAENTEPANLSINEDKKSIEIRI